VLDKTGSLFVSYSAQTLFVLYQNHVLVTVIAVVCTEPVTGDKVPYHCDVG